MKKYFVIGVVLFSLVAEGRAMNLKESIEVAIKNNPTVAASQKKVSAAKARFNQAVSAFFPTVNLSGSLNKKQASPLTVPINIGGVSQNVTIGTNDAAAVSGLQADLSQPIFVSALFPEYGIARKSFDAADQQYRQMVVDLNFAVTQGYFGVLQAIKMEKLMRDSLEMAKAHREQVQSMLNSGLARKADLLQSKVREAKYNVSLIQAQYNIKLAMDAFNNTLGVGMKSPVDLQDEGFSGVAGNLPEYEALLAAAYDNRPDWKANQLQVGIGEEKVKLAQTDYLPSIGLSANVGNQLTSYPSFQSNVNSWQVMGVGSWKLFDSFGRENRIAEARENLSAQQASTDQLSNNIALEVHTAYLGLKSALETVGATKQEVDSAEESHKVSSSLFNSGLGTNVDVLDAQVNLTQAWTDHLNALFNVEIAKAQINKAVGKRMI